MLLKTDDQMHARVIAFMDEIAKRNKFKYCLEESHANRELLIAVWDMCNMTAANQSKDNLDKLRELAYELVWASRMGEMMKCHFKEPDSETMDDIRRLFNCSPLRLDYQDKRYVEIEPQLISELKYTLETDDDSVLKLQPNVQMGLFETNEV
jgi:hypothetical protein